MELVLPSVAVGDGDFLLGGSLLSPPAFCRGEFKPWHCVTAKVVPQEARGAKAFRLTTQEAFGLPVWVLVNLSLSGV